MSKVYVVTAGSYSDYRIVAVYASRELAEEHHRRQMLAAGYGDETRVEEYDISERVSDAFVLHTARAVMPGPAPLRSYQSDDVSVYSTVVWEDEPDWQFRRIAVEPSQGEDWASKNPVFQAKGYDRGAVVKSVSDRRARYLAELADV